MNEFINDVKIGIIRSDDAHDWFYVHTPGAAPQSLWTKDIRELENWFLAIVANRRPLVNTRWVESIEIDFPNRSLKALVGEVPLKEE